MATRLTGSRNSLEDPNSNSAKAKNVVKNCYKKSFKEIKSALNSCKLNYSMLPGQQFYTISKVTNPDILLIAIKTEKFGKKVMVW